MKTVLSVIIAALAFCSAFAQSTPTFITGDVVIQYNTRTQLDGDKPKRGVTDKYRLKLNISNSIVFDGTIEMLPFIKNTLSSNQQGALIHAIECYVVNPKNPAQTLNIGRLFGRVPVDEQNVFRFADGDLKVATFARGSAPASESRAGGLALGKPPAKSSGLFNKALDKAKERINFGRVVNGQTVAIKVTNYDKMEFQSHVLAGGPIGKYSDVTLNGPMIYDYDRGAWLFNGVSATYVENGMRKTDNLTGSVRWFEAPNRKTSGEGWYDFDIRINEPPPNEAAMFSGPVNEDAFFAADAQLRGLTGTMKYKDTIINGSVTQSIVTVDLKGNQLTPNEIMYLGKLLMMSTIVPFNSE